MARTAQLAGKKHLDSMSLLGKTSRRATSKNLYQGKYKSLGLDVATGGCCQEAATLTDSQQSSPKHVVPVKTTRDSTTPPTPVRREALPLTSHAGQSGGRQRCVFS